MSAKSRSETSTGRQQRRPQVEQPSVNLALARYGRLVEMLVEKSHDRRGLEASPDDELYRYMAQAVDELVEARQIGVLAGLLQLMGGPTSELQQIVIERLSLKGDEAVSAIVEEVASRPLGAGTQGALLMLALVGTPAALNALDGVYGRLDIPYAVRSRASRLLSACRTGFFDEQRAFSEEIEPDAQTVRDLLGLLGGAVLAPLSAFHIDWLGTQDNPDFNLALLSLSSFVWRNNEFCNLLRTNGFEDNCLLSDQKAIKRAIASRKPQVYQCYAGLTDIVIPVVDDDHVIGTLMTGQVSGESPSRNSFREVSARLGRLPSSLRADLEKAYLETPHVEKADLENIVRALGIVARLLVNLWHKTQRSLQKTKQLHRLEYLGRRELIETLLFGEITQAELRSRLCELGITSMPNFAMLVQLSDIDQRTRGEPERRRMLSFERATLLVADHLEHTADAVVAPLRYGEIVGLMESPPARNPHLRRLRQKELAAELVRILRDKTGLNALIGIGPLARGVPSLRQSFEKAREALLHALGKGKEHVVHADDISAADSDEVAQFSRLEAEVATALCGDDERLISRFAGELLALSESDFGAEMSRCISLLVSIVGSAAELVVEQGAPREEIFPIKLEFMDRVRALQDPAHVSTLVTDLHRAFRQVLARAQVGRVHQRVALARDYLDNHFEEDMNREELAARVGMSPWHLTTTFRRIVGMSPRDYLHKTRIEAAKRQLLTTTDSIEDVAYAVGYGAAANFRRMFHKWVGCSPTAFRRYTDATML